MNFIEVLEASGILTKPIAILAYLYKNANEDGIVIATYKKIQAATNSTPPTVAKVMTRLQETGAIEKIQNGVWRICN